MSKMSDDLRKRASIRLKATARGELDRLAKQLIAAADRIDELEALLAPYDGKVDRVDGKVGIWQDAQERLVFQPFDGPRML
jgi:hypothetical protein